MNSRWSPRAIDRAAFPLTRKTSPTYLPDTIALSIALVSLLLSSISLPQDSTSLTCTPFYDTLTYTHPYPLNVQLQHPLAQWDQELTVQTLLVLLRAKRALAIVKTNLYPRTTGQEWPSLLAPLGWGFMVALASLFFMVCLRRYIRPGPAPANRLDADDTLIEVPEYLDPAQTVRVPADALQEQEERPFYALRVGSLTLIVKIYWRRVHF